MRSLALFLILLTLLHPTTISGEIFNGDNFQRLNNTQITVEDLNGIVLIQQVFHEQYQLEVPDGTYTLRAYYYVNGTLEYYAEHHFQASEEFMQFDLVLLPYELQILLPDSPPPPQSNTTNETVPPDNPPEEPPDYSLLYGAVIAVIVLVIAYLLYTRLSSSTPKEPTEETAYSLDKDSRKVLKILKEQEGRMYQRELREILKYSETKMSLLITELETQGYIKRIKRGRDNLLKLLKKASKPHK